MRKHVGILVAALSLVVCVCFSLAKPTGYVPRSYDVGLTSTMILPPVNPEEATWVTGTAYVVGNTVSVWTNGTKTSDFWCISAGTSSNVLPTWVATNDVTDGGVTWRPINASRSAFTIQNLGSANVSLSYGKAAVASRGITLTENGTLNAGYYGNACYQDAVYAISASGTNAVSVHEE